jgi:hypothetical protein
MRVDVLVIRTTPMAQAFDEVAESVCYSLRELGFESDFVQRPGTSLHVIFGANLLYGEHRAIPDGQLVYNLEQVNSPWMTKEYVDLLRRHVVFDFSPISVAWLKWNRVAVVGLSVGHCPAWERIQRCSEKKIDVFFYGYLNERRIAVLDSLKKLGVNVGVGFKLFGAKRDEYIAQSKLVLNMHYHGPVQTLELARVGYLAANAIPVGAGRYREARLRRHQDQRRIPCGKHDWFVKVRNCQREKGEDMHVNYTMYGVARTGGTQTFVEIGKRLIERGHKVSITAIADEFVLTANGPKPKWDLTSHT